ncbi:MAG: hypothetical protein N3F07_00195 [Candidatus Micrarchaeota archaeon]|nr:hypothetical protein [Candidatus Micrarchaeota archaeon]
MGRLLYLAAALALLAIFPSQFAYCPNATRSIYLAAVTGEDRGGVFLLEVDVRPGNGTIYTSIHPRTGLLTQESQEAAVEHAFAGSGIMRKECDVLFRIKGNFGENVVDGPSAGAAMAIAAKAALMNKSIRKDIVMTGSILPGGRIGEVGGIIEKGMGVFESKAKYFLVPKPMKIHEAVLFSTLSSSREFKVIEVSNLQEAERIAFSGYSEQFDSQFKPESRKLPSSLKIREADKDMARFSLVARKVVDELEEKVRQAFRESGESAEEKAMREYFLSEISKYRYLIAAGYPFTAANSAFLLSIDAEYARLGDAKVDFDKTIQNAKKCAASLQPPAKTAENIHWAIGADLRRIWSESKLNDTVERREEQGGYTTLRDVLYSYSWCDISQQLGKHAAEIGGRPIDESLLSSLSSQKLAEAKEAIDSAKRPDYDAIWHLKNGLKANETGKYGAAIYEATYAATMQQIASGGEANLSSAAEKLAEGERKTLWGKIYQSQGAYLYQEAKEANASFADAYRILKYSYELDKAALEIEEEIAKTSKKDEEEKLAEKAGEEKTPKQADYAIAFLMAAGLFSFGGIAASRLLRKR